MNTTLTRLLFAVVLVLGLVVPGQAGQRQGAISSSPSIGFHLFDSDQKLDDTASFGLAVGYNLTTRWAVELDGRYTTTETDLDGGGNQDVDVWDYSLNALYHFNPEGPWVPYLTAGFGNSVYQADGFKDDEDFMLNWGAGAKYFFTDSTALRLEARHIAGFHSDDRWGTAGRGDNTEHHFIVAAGLYFQFGGVTPPPPPPADGDQDGIPDARDKCPDTPYGTPVDAVGCPPYERVSPPPPPPRQPVERDSDDDGVLDSSDKCPNTPKGVIVDEDGCPVKFTLYIEFDFDKAQVRPEYHDDLREAAAFIRQYPEAKFLLAGHTDSIGTEEYNKVLSRQRAAAVKKYLVEEFGIAAHLLYPRGYGESQPIATNETEAGRQDNRRVEIICCVIIPPLEE